MKKSLCILLALFLVLTLLACTSGKAENASVPSTEPAKQESAVEASEETPAISDSEEKISAACIHDFDESGTCRKCGSRYIESMTDEEKSAVISWMYDRANQYAKKGQLKNAEDLDKTVWAEAEAEFPELNESEIDEIFFSSLNKRRARLGSSKKENWYADPSAESSSEQPAQTKRPENAMLLTIGSILDEGFAGESYEKNYDSEENVYYFILYSDGCSGLTSTSAFKDLCSGIDSISDGGHTALEIDFIARVMDGNLVVYESKNGLGKLLTQAGSSSSSADSGATTGEKNALRSARSYLNTMAFSYSGLIDQLKYEGYTDSEAKYAADHCGADWNEQAKKSAKSYLDIMAFSKQGLIEQLEYEGFTHEQAVYGVNQNWD